MEERVTTTIIDGVADVRLVRADKMNALDPAMFSALIDAGEALKANPSVRAVVLSGTGRAFCAGLDMGNFAAMADGSRGAGGSIVATPRTDGGANRAQQVAMVWREIPAPVVAAVHGVAFGGGFQIALGADLRFIAPDARLSVMEIRWGLVPDMGAMALLPSLVRDDVARELTFSGRQFTGEEAGRLGLATRVCADPLAEALTFAREVALKSPTAIRAAKRLLNLSRSGAPMRAVLMAESEEQAALIGSRNQVEAVRANLEKRAAMYVDVE